MIALATQAAAAPLMVAVAAADPIRAADLAARVALSGHTLALPDEAELFLADTGTALPPEAPALRIGPGSAIPADLSPAQLDAALRATALGLRVSLPTSHDGFAAAETRPLLTPRELDVLGLLGEGLSNKEVARGLGISAHTVKFHLEAIFDKLGAATRADAVAKGLRGGLILL